MRECRKCNEKIPYTIKENGVIRRLSGRKFCLNCSPYRGGNKYSIDPDHKNGKKRIYDEKRKDQITLSLYKRGLKRRKDLYGLYGDKCRICGYNKCLRALNFHHKDRSTKEFGLSLNNLWSKPWEIILKEARKCILLCSNCHMEIEDEISKKTKNIVKRVNDKYGTDF